MYGSTTIRCSYCGCWGAHICSGGSSPSYGSNYQSNEKKTMSIKESFISVFLTEPEKSYRKAGITNGDGLLTCDGRDIFLTWLLKQYPNFKTEVVDSILADQKEQKTCS
jgi:hypothetical protein